MKIASGLNKDADSPLVFIPNVEKLQKSLRCKVLWTMEKFCQKIQYTQTEISEIWGWK